MIALYTSLLDTPAQQEKFEYIYVTYQSLMLRTAQLIMKEQSLAEDVVHEVFLKMISNIDTIRMDDRSKLRSFLVHITKNKAIDMLRANKHEYTSDDASAESIHFPNTSSAEDILFNVRDFQIVVDLIKNLEEKYRAPLTLKTQGYTIAEIAKSLSITPENARVRIFRAKKMLRQQLEEHNNE